MPQWLGVARGVDQPGDAGRDEMLVLGGLEHVERLFVGEGGVVDVLDAVADALLDRSRGAGVGGQHLVAAAWPRFTAIATSSSDIGVSSAPMPVISSPERLSLIEVDAVFDELTHRAAHFFGPGDDDAEIEALVRNVRRRRIARARRPW